MARYLLVFRGGGFESRDGTAEDQQTINNQWQSWKQSIGQSLVDPGAATSVFATVGKNGKEEFLSDRVGGFTVLDAVNMDSAIAFAMKSPTVVNTDGRVDVYELFDPMSNYAGAENNESVSAAQLEPVSNETNSDSNTSEQPPSENGGDNGELQIPQS